MVVWVEVVDVLQKTPLPSVWILSIAWAGNITAIRIRIRSGGCILGCEECEDSLKHCLWCSRLGELVARFSFVSRN